MSAAIEVLQIRRVPGAGTIRAYVDLRFGGIIVKGAKIVQQAGQRAWLGMPGIKTNHGWQNVVELSKPLRAAATEIALQAFDGDAPDVADDAARVSGQGEPGNAPAGSYRRADAGKRVDPREQHINELAERFNRRPPDDCDDL